MLQLLKETVTSRHAERLEQIVIALIAVVGVMGLGYLVLGAVWLVGRRRRGAERANRYYVRPEMAGRTRVPTDEKYDDVAGH